MTTEYLLKELSHDVYKVDSKHDKYTLFKAGEIREIGDFEYKILKTENNTSNGMQAMAVAPVINGKADTSDIAIAYAGTNPAKY